MTNRMDSAAALTPRRRKSQLHWQLLLMVLPALIYLLIFHYKPMYGVVIANSLALGYVVAATGAFLSVASVKYVNQEYLARTSGIMSAASIAAMPVLSFIISGLVSFVTTAQCFIFAGVCALLECIWILKNKGIEGNM